MCLLANTTPLQQPRELSFIVPQLPAAASITGYITSETQCRGAVWHDSTLKGERTNIRPRCTALPVECAAELAGELKELAGESKELAGGYCSRAQHVHKSTAFNTATLVMTPSDLVLSCLACGLLGPWSG